MERKLLNVELKEKTGNTIIRQRTRVRDRVQQVTIQNGNGLDTSPD